MKRLFLPLLIGVTSLGLLASCNDDNDGPNQPISLGVPLAQVATSTVQWTGVGVSKEGRIFANFPRMETDTIPYSVAEVSGAQATPFPNADWNTWNPTLSAQNHFVCVQSVIVDDQNFLWVLDAASPQMRGVVQNGAKLLKFDLSTKQLVQRISFPETVVYPGSYLNDVRVDTQKKFAYITDSNIGAIIVVNLATGESRRLLGNDPSTKSENLILTVEGRVWRNRAGQLPSVHSDGLALTPDRAYLYYHATTARTLYRIGTQYLQDAALPGPQLAQKVENLGQTEPTDGMEFDPAGNLYLTTIQLNAVTRITPGNQTQIVSQSTQLKWPDSYAVGPDGSLYVTTSQLHIPRAERTEPYRIFKFKP
ncbi:L-dopachrome tautomerase-related protein [Hymenobacter sp. GOD-10R]|uniref:L-dopachrome tautomerase-related protein n=1 Tax=Hymenobacter sp. GOD-10R TaxID=3093922 RepID=UPI002D769A30|nr:L-dopachrome tautomerase-related protein [Hymenobacter sp. GOD-10R]WRQ29039.1 L-dopachrome tautomerase-related protein [Hymenobacter sp. GOD-10R]